MYSPITALSPASRSPLTGYAQLSIFLCLISSALLLPAGAVAQSRNELNTLFFDAVYLDDPQQILLSSGDRPGMGGFSTEVEPEAPDRQPSEILEDIRRYESGISSLIETNGIFDPVLAQEYQSVGDLYELLGDRENAVKAFENAMHVSRVNQGLFAISQTEAVRALIASNKAARNFPEADKYHEYLYYLISQNLEPGDDELLSASLEWADWNLEAYRRMTFLDEDGLSVSGNVSSAGASMLRRGELVAIEDNQFSEILFVPRTALLNNPGTLRMQSYTAEQLVDPRLDQAQDLYEKLLENHTDHLDILHRLANITFMFKTQLEQLVGQVNIGSPLITSQARLLRSVSALRSGYADNRERLLDLAMSLEADEPVKAAGIYLNVGDWDLVFERQTRAKNTYDKARELLLAQGMSETEITEFITPEPALLVPDYVTYEFTRDFQNIPETRDIPYIGYIDVNFDKRPNGTLRRIDIENVSENTGQQVRERLLDLLQSAIMRPLFVAGESVPQSDIKVRYYYSY